MSFSALKWALKPEGAQANRPRMTPEKKLFLYHLAWEANQKDNRIRKDIETLAAQAGISKRVASRVVRELLREGPLRLTDERAGKTGRVAVYEFRMEWIRGNGAADDTIMDTANGAVGDTIAAGSNGAADDTIHTTPNDTISGRQTTPLHDAKRHHYGSPLYKVYKEVPKKSKGQICKGNLPLDARPERSAAPTDTDRLGDESDGLSAPEKIDVQGRGV
ncbi:hypothetical protein BZM27_27570 [Paraburkholderia steynii]|uniref:Helix-turn-helix domain-containing protein n=1 Tax=Paraburkholderia steynii TaxID=1245441 RepID=A0A4R0X7S2_9BURK|nr:hypothetical protein BZM27_27570 [Paraburkholderia steynii]